MIREILSLQISNYNYPMRHIKMCACDAFNMLEKPGIGGRNLGCPGSVLVQTAGGVSSPFFIPTAGGTKISAPTTKQDPTHHSTAAA